MSYVSKAKKTTPRPTPPMPIVVPTMPLSVVEKMLRRDGVRCEDCTAFFPLNEDGDFRCLSGCHGKKSEEGTEIYCDQFEVAFFRLVSWYEYTPKQTFVTREVERSMKISAGKREEVMA